MLLDCRNIARRCQGYRKRPRQLFFVEKISTDYEGKNLNYAGEVADKIYRISYSLFYNPTLISCRLWLRFCMKELSGIHFLREITRARYFVAVVPKVDRSPEFDLFW